MARVNDLAVSGAKPLALTATLILEAGLPSEILRREVEAMAAAARHAGVPIVGGDTKVVEHGKADGMYITTTGLGVVDPRESRPERVQPGDRVLLSGPIGNHGMAIMLARAELEIEADIQLRHAAAAIGRGAVERRRRRRAWMRDATRGGVATVLNELARDADVESRSRRRRCRSIFRSAVLVNCWVWIRCKWPTKANSSLSSPPIGPSEHWPPCDTPGGERACLLGEIEAGRAVRAGQGGLRRHPRCRYADWRSVAADLLTRVRDAQLVQAISS